MVCANHAPSNLGLGARHSHKLSKWPLNKLGLFSAFHVSHINLSNLYVDWAFKLCLWVACVNTKEKLALDSNATTSLINQHDNMKGKGVHVKI